MDKNANPLAMIQSDYTPKEIYINKHPPTKATKGHFIRSL